MKVSRDGDWEAFPGPVLGHLCVWIRRGLRGVPADHTGERMKG